MHGTIMVFFVISMGLVSGFGNFLIPLHVGARDMAYPFLNMLSYWVVVPACFLMIASFFVEGGAAAAGWTAYPPLSALEVAVPGSGMGQTLWLLAMALFIVSFTMGSLNYLTTILNERTKGMSMMRLPLVVWTYLISSILGILAFPALTAAAVMLLFDRHAGTSFFLPAGMYFPGTGVLPNMGGTPLLFQHLFWFLGHPEVYVLVLPALGIAFEVIAAFGRRATFGYRTSVYSMLCIAFLSMIVWGHHMFTSGMDPRIGEYFSIVTVIITVPFAVIGLNLIGSLWQARIRLHTPMLFGLAIISAIGIGGLGGLYLGTATSDMYFHDSYFVVGHFHFTIGTVTFLALFAGIYFWFPKIFGRKTSELLGKFHFWLTVVPMFTMFILMHFQGLGGVLRRTYDTTTYSYNAGGRGLMLPITVLGFILFGAQLIFLINMLWSLFRGEKVGENPWEATTLEWTAPSPAPHGNWVGELPVVHRMPYDYRRNGSGHLVLPQNVESAEEVQV
jgi:cytochrome c oxidase subunit 1